MKNLMYPVSPLYSHILHPRAWIRPGRRRLRTMLRLAGKLLILTGILLLLAFVFQLPYLYEILNDPDAGFAALFVPVLWRLGLIAAGAFLIHFGRKMI